MSSTSLYEPTLNGDSPAANSAAPRSPVSRVYTPQFDLWENDDEFVLYGDMPGVSPDQLEISYEDGRLTINGRVESLEDRKYTFNEYGVGDFYREFFLGDSVNVDGIAAEARDGVVTIRLPKPEISKPRRIEVKAS